MASTSGKAIQKSRYGAMHGMIFTAIIALHAAVYVYYLHFGARPVTAHSGRNLVALHIFIFIAIAMHVVKMGRRKKARATGLCRES